MPTRAPELPVWLVVAGGAALLALLPNRAEAHVRWFIDEQRYPPDWGRIASWATLLVVGVTLGLLLGLLLVRRVVGQHFPNPAFLAYMEPSATALLAVQTGVSLIYFASQRDLFVAELGLPGSPLGWLLIALQVTVAFTLITGLFDRAGALLLAGVWLLGLLIEPAWVMAGQLLYVGVALALAVLGRTIPPPGVARRLIGLKEYERQAVVALRVLTGVAIATVAFTEKLLVPRAGEAFLAVYPKFNFMRYFFGVEWFSDYRFTIAAGVAEAAIGILLASGVLSRVVILAMLVPFNVTVAFLPAVELLGHLPIFGVMYVLLLYGSGADPRASERRLEPALAGGPPAHPAVLE